MAILFDLDGTLLDTGPDIHNAVNALLKEENLPLVDYKLTRELISFGGEKILKSAFNLDQNNQAHTLYAQKLISRFLKLYTNSGFTNTKPFPGIEELIKGLAKLQIPWGVVTNKHAVLAKPQLAAHKSFSTSACLVAGDTTAHSKPHPAPLQHACKLMNVKPEDCIYVGDAETDVKAGKAAGMRTIVASFGYIPTNVALKDWEADYIASNPLEILSWIEKWHKQGA